MGHRIGPAERLRVGRHVFRPNARGDAEIDQNRRFAHNHDILRLHIAVEDAVSVRKVKSRGKRAENRKEFFERKSIFMSRLPFEPVPQSPAVRVLHDKKVAKIRVDIPSQKRTDARVIQIFRKVKNTADFF